MPQLETTTFLTQYVWLTISLFLSFILVGFYLYPSLIKAIYLREYLSSLGEESSLKGKRCTSLVRRLWDR